MILEKFKSFCEALPQNAAPKAELRMSSSGDCIRLLDYQHQMGPKPISFQSFMRMELGHASHLHLQHFFKEFLGEDLIGVEEEIFYEGIPGHPDGRIVSLKATLEIKSVSDATFRMIQKQNRPLDQHIDQSNFYAHAVKDEWVLIFYINRDTGQCTEFMFEMDVSLAQKVKEKFEKVRENKARGILSPRPYRNAEESPCWFCSYVKECYEGFASEVDGGSTTQVSDPHLVGEARRAIKMRDSRLLADKIESQIKTMLADSLIVKKIKVAKFTDEEGDMLAEVKIGKNNNPLINIKEVKNG